MGTTGIVLICAAVGAALIWYFVKKQKEQKAKDVASLNLGPRPRPVTTGVLPKFGAVTEVVSALRVAA